MDADALTGRPGAYRRLGLAIALSILLPGLAVTARAEPSANGPSLAAPLRGAAVAVLPASPTPSADDASQAQPTAATPDAPDGSGARQNADAVLQAPSQGEPPAGQAPPPAPETAAPGAAPAASDTGQPAAPAAVQDGSTAPQAAAPKPDRSITIYENTAVRHVIGFLLQRKRDVLERGLSRSGRYLPMIRRIFAEVGLPKELAYLAAVESNFNPHARSPARAVGMWQLMPATARKFGLKIRRPWYDERLDPELATRTAARLLTYLFDRYGSWELALAAYNAGEGRVNRALQRARRRGRPPDYWRLRLPRQTRGFVPTFLAMVHIFQHPEAYSLDGITPQAPLQGELVELHRATTLQDIASRLDMPLNDLIDLNPAWRRGIVPPMHHGTFEVRVPPQNGARLLASLQNEPARPIPWLVHRVREGDTVSQIAQLYGVRSSAVLALNGLHRRSLLSIGQPLLVPVAKNDPVALRQQRLAEKAPQWEATPSKQPAITQLHIHTVEPGESLWTISRQYGVRMTDLRRWNGLDNNVIHPHQELSVFVSDSREADNSATF